MNDEILTIMVVSDSGYLPFVRVLFNSIKANVSIPYRFHLHAINIDDNRIALLESLYPNITFSRDTIVLDEKPNKKNAFNKSKKAAYCANIRAKVINELLLRGDKYILYLDADSIVKKDLDKLFLLMKYTDLIIFRRDKETNPQIKVLTSVIGVNNNDASKRFIDNWMRFMMQETVLYTWFSDQKYFYKTMTKHPDVKVQPLEQLYVDAGFNSKSYIWNGKAGRKYDNKAYIKEMEKYK